VLCRIGMTNGFDSMLVDDTILCGVMSVGRHRTAVRSPGFDREVNG
jgi:hypothetical protein